MFSLYRSASVEFIGTGVFAASIVAVNYPTPVSPFAKLVTAITLGIVLLLSRETSGGLLNPATTLFFAVRRQISWLKAGVFMAAQTLGALAGVWLGAELYGQNLWTVNAAIIGKGQLLSEVAATTVLIWLVGYLGKTARASLIPVAGAAWIFAASTFTSSGAVANPAITIGRMFTPVAGAGIGVEQGLYFILAQSLGVLLGLLGATYLTPANTKGSKPKKKKAKAGK